MLDIGIFFSNLNPKALAYLSVKDKFLEADSKCRNKYLIISSGQWDADKQSRKQNETDFYLIRIKPTD